MNEERPGMPMRSLRSVNHWGIGATPIAAGRTREAQKALLERIAELNRKRGKPA